MCPTLHLPIADLQLTRGGEAIKGHCCSLAGTNSFQTRRSLIHQRHCSAQKIRNAMHYTLQLLGEQFYDAVRVKSSILMTGSRFAAQSAHSEFSSRSTRRFTAALSLAWSIALQLCICGTAQDETLHSATQARVARQHFRGSACLLHVSPPRGCSVQLNNALNSHMENWWNRPAGRTSPQEEWTYWPAAAEGGANMNS